MAEILEILDRLRTLTRRPVESTTPAERRREFQLDLMRLHRVAVRHFGVGDGLVREILDLLRTSIAGGTPGPWTRRLHRLLNQAESRTKAETRAAFRRLPQDLGGGD